MGNYVFGFNILKQFLFGIAYSYGSWSCSAGIFSVEFHPRSLRESDRVWFSFYNEFRKEREG